MAEESRQRVERVPGRGRRAKLTPAPGSDPSPEHPAPGEEQPAADRAKPNPDDERITRERPPHW
jgi:hypothetical protein